MGLLKNKECVSFEKLQEMKDAIKKRGVEQFIRIYQGKKDVVAKFSCGDEIECMLVGEEGENYKLCNVSEDMIKYFKNCHKKMLAICRDENGEVSCGDGNGIGNGIGNGNGDGSGGNGNGGNGKDGDGNGKDGEVGGKDGGDGNGKDGEVKKSSTSKSSADKSGTDKGSASKSGTDRSSADEKVIHATKDKNENVIHATDGHAIDAQSLSLRECKKELLYLLKYNPRRIKDLYGYDSLDIGITLIPEFASYMVETIPICPITQPGLFHLDMKQRISLVEKTLKKFIPCGVPLLMTTYPLIGQGNPFFAKRLAAYDFAARSRRLTFDTTDSVNFPDNAVNSHPRFYSFLTNIARRRGRRIEGYCRAMSDECCDEEEIEVLGDTETVNDGSSRTASGGHAVDNARVNARVDARDGHAVNASDKNVNANNARVNASDPVNAGDGNSASDFNIDLTPDLNTDLKTDTPTNLNTNHSAGDRTAPFQDTIVIDSMGQGMGCSCLQLTVQPGSIDDARFIHDQLAVLGPLLLRLTRATPFSTGKLLNSDTRWDFITFSVDCRRTEERGCDVLVSGLCKCGKCENFRVTGFNKVRKSSNEYVSSNGGVSNSSKSKSKSSSKSSKSTSSKSKSSNSKSKSSSSKSSSSNNHTTNNTTNNTLTSTDTNHANTPTNNTNHANTPTNNNNHANTPTDNNNHANTPTDNTNHANTPATDNTDDYSKPPRKLGRLTLRRTDKAPLIPKSRFSAVDLFLSPEGAAYCDAFVPLHAASLARLRASGVDELLCRHIASLFVRDPLLAYADVDGNGSNGSNGSGSRGEDGSGGDGDGGDGNASNGSGSRGVDGSGGDGSSNGNGSGSSNGGNANKNAGPTINANKNASPNNTHTTNTNNNTTHANTNNTTHANTNNTSHANTNTSPTNNTTHTNTSDSDTFDDFENIQSSNWRSVRFKIPLDDGWRVELRTMEIQPTVFENSAIVGFVMLLIKHVLRRRTCFYVPMSMVNENFRRANLFTHRAADYRDDRHAEMERLLSYGAARAGPGMKFGDFRRVFEGYSLRVPKDDVKFFYRRNTGDDGEAVVAEGTLDEIFNGTGTYKGIIQELMEEYPSYKAILTFIRMKADNSLVSVADYHRYFVINHEEYRNDSVITQGICNDLIRRVNELRKMDSWLYLKRRQP